MIVEAVMCLANTKKKQMNMRRKVKGCRKCEDSVNVCIQMVKWIKLCYRFTLSVTHQTRGMLSITFTCAIATISPIYLLLKVKPVQVGVLSAH